MSESHQQNTQSGQSTTEKVKESLSSAGNYVSQKSSEVYNKVQETVKPNASKTVDQTHTSKEASKASPAIELARQKAAEAAELAKHQTPGPNIEHKPEEKKSTGAKIKEKITSAVKG
ncbi:hypothetical protein HDU92_005023 [Lobulomyces angularis]|nr:hypothetical protein HDU92_005023 [Lobulomyces angularis]